MWFSVEEQEGEIRRYLRSLTMLVLGSTVTDEAVSTTWQSPHNGFTHPPGKNREGRRVNIHKASIGDDITHVIVSFPYITDVVQSFSTTHSPRIPCFTFVCVDDSRG